MAAIDPTKAKARTTYPHPGVFYSFAADGDYLYAGSDDYSVYVFDPVVAKKEPVARWTKHDNYVSALVCLERGAARFVVSGSYDRHLVWWDAESGEAFRAIEAHAGWVRDLAAAPVGWRFVSCGDDMLV